jgi:MFS family permease
LSEPCTGESVGKPARQLPDAEGASASVAGNSGRVNRTTLEPRGQRALRSGEKRRLALLGLPTFGLALSITIVSAYLPKVAQGFTSSTVAIGAIVAGEGVMALWIPLVVGPWSDRLRTRLGGRLPFLIAGAPAMAVALLAMGLASSLWGIAVAAAVFFAAYFVAYEPYRALYPDLVGDDEIAGRAQSTQAMWRGAGTGLALLTGGILLSGTPVLPFALAAVVILGTTTTFAIVAVRLALTRESEGRSQGGAARVWWLLARHPALRAFLLANALWELALAAVKTFVVLYLTDGLGLSLVTASLLVGATGAIIFAGAVAAGKLGDRIGRLRVMRWALVIYGIGFGVPMLVTVKALIAIAVPAIAIGGGAVMALAYAILMPLMPEEERGALTGYYSLSRGIGIVLGPVLAGALVSLTADGIFAGTHGFQAVWIVPFAATMASLPLLRRLAAERADREELRAS